MAAEITGTIKYAQRMAGESNGKAYEFFSFVVLDTDEGVKWPLQVDEKNAQYKELCQGAAQLIDQRVRVVIRSFSAGTRLDKKTNQRVPQARFYAKSVTVLQPAAASR